MTDREPNWALDDQGARERHEYLMNWLKQPDHTRLANIIGILNFKIEALVVELTKVQIQLDDINHRLPLLFPEE